MEFKTYPVGMMFKTNMYLCSACQKQKAEFFLHFALQLNICLQVVHQTWKTLKQP